MAEREKRTRAATVAARKRGVGGPEDAATRAGQRLAGLICHPTEGVSAVRRTDEGWLVSVDVLEVPRIPDTTSLLATYEVELDRDGEMLQYRRVRRYRRGASDD
ncbi:gas vesicle protein GvpO [Streptomyces sp. NPDC002055]|uniref:gas vesicle protein GvpO n=1 Tax=Streptomyces sp. NPDC002055 TaxID=3154534 RepID=UPI00331DDA6A